jgi:hypothetical protein
MPPGKTSTSLIVADSCVADLWPATEHGWSALPAAAKN